LYILGISSYYHDSAACLIHEGKIIAAAQEERFTRLKHDSTFPANSIKFCLEYEGLNFKDIDEIVFYEKPLLKFERVLENFLYIAPKGLKAFVKYMPLWIKEKLFTRKSIHDALNKLGLGKTGHIDLKFSDHHLSHAAWAFCTSTFEKAAILTIDGVGEWATTAIYQADGNEFKLLKEQRYPHSLGLLYSAFTQFLGFKVNDGEYKVMGLAPYGSTNSGHYKKSYRSIVEELVHLGDDGGLKLNMEYFDFMKGNSMISIKKWEALFEIEYRKASQPLSLSHCHLALALQDFTTQVILKLAKHAKELSGLDNLCFSGGVAYNCAANGELIRSGLFKNVHIPPAVGDSGSAAGAALAFDSIVNKRKRDHSQALKNDISFLGPSFTNNQIASFYRKKDVGFKTLEEDELLKCAARLLVDGEIVGWFQGRMEFGARALGARSILANPLLSEMQSKVNMKIKFRESFRPFALMILEEDLEEFYGMKIDSPYMAIIAHLLPKYRKDLPSDFDSMSITEKCSYDNSAFPAITHVDYSTRIQTVDAITNPLVYKLLKEVKRINHFGMLLNTSFNVKDEPIVCTIQDAYSCFANTEMNHLIAGNTIISKNNGGDHE